MIPTRYLEKNAWPHKFIKTGNLKPGDDGLPVQEFFCFHCQRVWKMGQEPRPIGACPARTDSNEMRRLLG